MAPEAINQAGFCKGAMTVDHILTIQTIVQKYKKLKKPVYGAFIDFAKAFDTVWRDALRPGEASRNGPQCHTDENHCRVLQRENSLPEDEAGKNRFLPH